MLEAWLLLVIAALVVACLSLYFHAQRMESDSLLQRSLAEEELRIVEQTLETTREHLQTQPLFPPPPPRTSLPERPEDVLSHSILNLHHAGKSTRQIARELGVPSAAIELVLSLKK